MYSPETTKLRARYEAFSLLLLVRSRSPAALACGRLCAFLSEPGTPGPVLLFFLLVARDLEAL